MTVSKWEYIRTALEEWVQRNGDRPDRFDCYDIAHLHVLDADEVWKTAKRLYW